MKRLTKLLLGISGVVLAIAVPAWLLAVPVAPSLSRPALPLDAPITSVGAVEFEGASFGGLSLTAIESHAIPWRIAAAAFVMDEVARDPEADISIETLDLVLSRFGFLTKTEPLNRPSNAVIENDFPLGLTHAFISPVGGSKLLVANLGCASCHAGVTYDETGGPRPEQSWLGMPNTSLNLEAYVLEMFRALQNQIDRPDDLIEAAREMFPDMDWRETVTLRWLIMPTVKKRLEALQGAGRPLPFPNGVPGATNGVAALKHALGMPLKGGGAADRGIVSIPELGSRVWRTSLLADGAYAPPNVQRQRAIMQSDVDGNHLRSLSRMTTFFTVPSMGVHPDEAIEYGDESDAIFEFLARSYAPQPFPAETDVERAFEGYEHYQSTCAACHGTYDWNSGQPSLVEFPNWIGDVGTDTLRAEVFTEDLANTIGETEYAGTISAVVTQQYSAPPLAGLWASAPYLHNGSVPTIEGLLSPELRPDRFMIGGHALDFEQMGVRLTSDGQYPAGYAPFSVPVWYDTGSAGQSNAGHLFGAVLDADAKRNLIEFLKLL